MSEGNKAILLSLERIPDLDVYGATINRIYTNPTEYGLTNDNIYSIDGTDYLKLNKNGSTWETLTINNLPMACISSEVKENNVYPVVPCYYRVVEAGFLGNDDVFHPIDPEVITVTYTGTNAEEIDGHTAILAKKTSPDKLTINNKTDFTNVEVQKKWLENTPYTDSVTVRLYRIADEPEQAEVNENTTIHLTVTLTDGDGKATAVTAHINGQDVSLQKEGNTYTKDVIVPKGHD